MKEPWSISKETLVAVEEGTSRIEEHECAKPAGRNDVCKQAIQCVKLFLYFGLLMIVGWACYSIWQPYHAQSMEVKVTAIIPEVESQNLPLLGEQPTYETSTIEARPFSGSEDSNKQDVVDDLQKFSPDYQDEILNSENTESSLGWPTYTDFPDLPKAMNFPFFLPSFPSMEVDESEKEPGSSENAQRLVDISEKPQLLEEDEKIILENYMLLSLLVQNSLKISEALKDSKEVVDPKFQLELEGIGQSELENSGPLELEDSSRLESDNSGPLQWFISGPFESQKEIGSDLKDSEEKPISTQTDDNYESDTSTILNNTHEIVAEDSTEPEQEETLIMSSEQMHPSIDYGVVDWFGQSAFREREYRKEQLLLEKSTVRNAEAWKDSTEEVDHNFKPTSERLSLLDLMDFGIEIMKDSVPLESEGLDPFEWEYSDEFASSDYSPQWEPSGPLESQKEIDSELEDSEEKPISTQTDDNYESDTSTILNNTHEIVAEDSTEPEQEETLIMSSEQMHPSIDYGVVDWFGQSAFREREYRKEQLLLEKSTVRNAEAWKDSTEEVDHNFKPTSERLSLLDLMDFGIEIMKDSVPLESEGLDPFEWEYSDEFASSDYSPQWEPSGPLESQKEIDSELEDSEEKPISTQTDDNYESDTSTILNNTHEIVAEDSTEPEQEETLIMSSEQMHPSIDYGVVDWFGQSAFREREYRKEQLLLEKSTVRNAEAWKDSTEEVDHNFKPTSERLSLLDLMDFGIEIMKDSVPLESEGLDPFEWEYSDEFASSDYSPQWEPSGPLESQKEIDSELEDSEEKPISTQTDDNYESDTSTILNNTHEIVSEDSTEPEQEETLIKSNEQMHQSMDSTDLDWSDQSASEGRKHEEKQATDETEEDAEISPFTYNSPDSIGNTHSLGVHSDTGESLLENESDEESGSDSFDEDTYELLLNLALEACSDASSYSWEQDDIEDPNNSYGSGELDICNASTKAFCEYRKQTLKITDCSKDTIFMLGRSD